LAKLVYSPHYYMKLGVGGTCSTYIFLDAQLFPVLNLSLSTHIFMHEFSFLHFPNHANNQCVFNKHVLWRGGHVLGSTSCCTSELQYIHMHDTTNY